MSSTANFMLKKLLIYNSEILSLCLEIIKFVRRVPTSSGNHGKPGKSLK